MIDELISPITLKKDSEQPNIMADFNKRVSNLYQRMLRLSTDNLQINRVQDVIETAANRAKQAIFVEDELEENEAIQIRRAHLSKETKNISDLLLIGNISLYLHDFYTASIAFSPCLESDEAQSFSPGQNYLLSLSMMHFSSYESALHYISLAISYLADPYRSDAHFRLGIIYLKLGRNKEALKSFHSIKRNAAPWISDIDILLLSSQTYLSLGDLTHAISVIEKTRIITPAVLQQKCFLYLLSNESRKIEKGIQILQNSPATNLSPNLLYLQGRLLFKKGHLKDAFVSMNMAISIKNDEPLFWCAMGNIYFKSTQFQEAALCFNKAMFYDNEMLEAWVNYGTTLEIDPAIGDPLKFYAKAYDEGNIPIKKEAIKRKDLFETVKMALIPHLMEPNDRDRFRNSADMIINLYLTEIPNMSLKKITNTELMAKSLKENAPSEDESGNHSEEEMEASDDV